MSRDEPRSRRRRPAAEAARQASQPWAGRCRLSPCAPLRTRRACCLPSSGWWPRRRTQTCSSRTTRAGSCLALRAARKRGQGRPSSWWSPVLGRPARRAVPRAALRRAGRQGEGEGALAAPRPGGQGRAQGRHGHHLRKAVGQDWRPAADGGEPRDARGGRRVGPRDARPAARARLPPGAQADDLLVRAGRLGGPRRDDRRGAPALRCWYESPPPSSNPGRNARRSADVMRIAPIDQLVYG